MVVTWIAALGLIAFAQIATRNMRAVPSGAQNLLEWTIEGLYGFLKGILGAALVERTFWFFATIFIFILAANWIGLVPGVGSIGWGHHAGGRFIVDEPLFRGANADVNMTLAMALVFFVCWVVWSLQEIGARGLVKELFGAKGESTGALRVLLAVVFFAAGCLELISILFRPISLSFRLYGNIFAGETMLETMARVPRIGWLVQVPFYFLELLVGLVQALVFTLLTAVFTLLMCQHEKQRTRMNDLYIGIAALGAAPAVGFRSVPRRRGGRAKSGSSTPVGSVHSLHRVRRGHRLLRALPCQVKRGADRADVRRRLASPDRSGDQLLHRLRPAVPRLGTNRYWRCSRRAAS